MSTLLLIRHGRTTANSAGVLAGWTPGVLLDDSGEQQVRALAQRLLPVPLARVVTSPLERCQQTTELLLSPRSSHPPVAVDERLAECRYGDWTGRTLRELARERLWQVVQRQPSAAVFPGPSGESLRAMASRAIEAARGIAADLDAEAGPAAIGVVVSHGDVLKAILADALGMHLDDFQRIQLDTASVSIVHYSPQRTAVERVNDVGGSVAGLGARPRRRRVPRGDAVPGGDI